MGKFKNIKNSGTDDKKPNARNPVECLVRRYSDLKYSSFTQSRLVNLHRDGYQFLTEYYSETPEEVKGTNRKLKNEVLDTILEYKKLKYCIAEVVYWARYDFWGIPYVFIWYK